MFSTQGRETEMPQQTVDKTVPEPERREIFLALVDAQDRELTVAQSRLLISEKFGVSENQVRDIEREGLDNGWPPL
jgi:hypothetical protein